jgi:preprotein translocase subunit Sec61beta
LIEKIELVEEAVVVVCIAVSRAVIVVKFNTGTERVEEKRDS